MPYQTFDEENAVAPDINLPHHLDHKPVYAMPYQRFDGIYRGNSDASYISVGLSQWDEKDLSVKIMRHTGGKWTRQAEELPIHRVLDAAIFLVKVLLDRSDSTIELESNLFTDQGQAIRIIREELSAEEAEVFEAFLVEKEDLLMDRVRQLYRILSTSKALNHI
jgi:hypothetical protein